MKKIDSELELKNEVHKCTLCHNAECSAKCKECNVDKIIRAVYFEDLAGARTMLKSSNPCAECKAPCQKVCNQNVDIKGIIEYVSTQKLVRGLSKDIDISTNVCGVKLENPFMLSSSVVGSTYDMCRRAFEAGWAGVVFKTICLMDIHEASPRFSALKNWDNSFNGFKNIEQLSDHTLEENLDILKRLKEEFPNKILIASIMGRNVKEWEYLAQKVTEAGVDVIELNFSCPNMEYKGTGSDVGQDSKTVEKYTKAVRKVTKLPILAKMTPNIEDMRIPARASKNGGADGIAAINTIKSITNIELKNLVPEPAVNGKSVIGGYSGRAVKPIALKFISDLSNDSELSNMHISAMGGIYTWKDAVDFLLLGAESLQVTTAVMEYGYRIIDDLILGVKIFMKEHGFTSLNDFVGASKKCIVENDEVERDTIAFPVFDYEKCKGCGRCYISCMDGGHQAITFDEKERKPKLNGAKCVGCHLCKLVCPHNAIGTAEKRIKAIKK